MRYALVLWDFDGTLADTLPGVLRIFNDLAPQLGLTPISDVQAVRDTTVTQFLKAQGIPFWRLPALRQAIVTRQKEDMASIRLCPGMPEVLERLGRNGCRMGIVSSNAEDNIRTCLRANGVEPWFEFVVGSSRLLGKQRSLRRVLRKTALDGRDVLYIGDEVRDIAAAQDVGIDVAAVTWGINSRSLLAQHSPTQLIDRPEQLLDWLGQASAIGE
jgi:phosphoglycolate phosphatase